MHDALTDLYAYALALDAEWRQLSEDLEEFARARVGSPEDPSMELRLEQMREELDALRAVIAVFRDQADPGGTYL
jgi:hypothetical protein